jgi:uridine kinase
MARWAPARGDVIGEIADEVLHNFPTGRILVGVDGRGGSGKTTFAADLAAAFAARGTSAVSMSLEAYADAAAVNARARYEHPYDEVAFRADAIQPFRTGEPVRLEHRSRRDGTLVPHPLTWLPESNAVLVVEGSFLLRPETVGLWHSSLWLNVTREQSIERTAERDGPAAAAAAADAEDRYIADVNPVKRAVANIDMTDPAHPRRTFSDSC